MCFAPQRRALFQNLNFPNCTGHASCRQFWLQNALRAAMPCTFSTAQLPKVSENGAFFPTSLCGILVFDCALPPRPSRPVPPAYSHNLSPHNLLTRNLTTHNLITTQLVTTQLTHTQLDHTQLWPHTTYTQLTHVQFAHAQLDHTHTTWPHNLLTHNLSPHNLLTHNLSPHNLLTHRGRRGTSRHRHRSSLRVAGVALTALGWLWWRAWAPFGAAVAAAVCGAGVALGHIDQSLCMAGVALRDIDRHFAWQAWHLSHWAGSGGVLGPRLAPLAPRLFAWQAWHLATSTVTLRGKCGTYGTGLAAMARLGPVWRRGRCRLLTWRHRPSLCMAGVALRNIDRHFAWQAWHLWHWAGWPPPFAWQAWHLATSTSHFAWQAWPFAT